MATLSGFGVPAQNAPMWDHTYVTSSDGRGPWGCWGRSSGGKALAQASAMGSSTIADCISQSNSRAGIVYAITGVCHQTANRILDPAARLVSSARGYGVSRFAYQTYGLNTGGRVPQSVDWPQRKWSCSQGGGGGGKGGGGAAGGGRGPKARRNKKPSARALIARIRDLYEAHAVKPIADCDPITGTMAAESLRLNEALVRDEAELYMDLLIPDVSPRNRQRVLDVHLQLLQQRIQPAARVTDGEISGSRFAEEMNQIIRERIRELEAILGPDQFSRYAQVPNSEIPDLVDPAIAEDFFEFYGQSILQPA